MAHTKGEWKWNHLGKNDFYVHEASVRIKNDVPFKNETSIVARVFAKSRGKVEANAKLIAQAPKFLKAAKKLMDEANSVSVEFPESTWDALNELEEAIKATE